MWSGGAGYGSHCISPRCGDEWPPDDAGRMSTHPGMAGWEDWMAVGSRHGQVMGTVKVFRCWSKSPIRVTTSICQVPGGVIRMDSSTK